MNLHDHLLPVEFEVVVVFKVKTVQPQSHGNTRILHEGLILGLREMAYGEVDMYGIPFAILKHEYSGLGNVFDGALKTTVAFDTHEPPLK